LHSPHVVFKLSACELFVVDFAYMFKLLQKHSGGRVLLPHSVGEVAGPNDADAAAVEDAKAAVF
jgi:hypothetical protein